MAWGSQNSSKFGNEIINQVSSDMEKEMRHIF